MLILVIGLLGLGIVKVVKILFVYFKMNVGILRKLIFLILLLILSKYLDNILFIVKNCLNFLGGLK